MMRTSGASTADATMIGLTVAIAVGLLVILMGGPTEFMQIVESFMRGLVDRLGELIRSILN
jgi:3-hydroxyisobutyrate dehydrogenase-like beta-hydroxyacid dehydrogenase